MLSNILVVYGAVTLVKLMYDKAVTVTELMSAAVWPYNLVMWVIKKVWN